MQLKYQNEIDNLDLHGLCPDEVFPPSEEINVFRFSYDPIDHVLNFLPNVVFDRLKPIPFNYKTASPHVKCKRSGASYYIDADNAQDKWDNLPEQVRANLGYTHLATGTLDANDGFMRQPDIDGHFGFYESDNADLAKKFTLAIVL